MPCYSINPQTSWLQTVINTDMSSYRSLLARNRQRSVRPAIYPLTMSRRKKTHKLTWLLIFFCWNYCNKDMSRMISWLPHTAPLNLQVISDLGVTGCACVCRWRWIIHMISRIWLVWFLWRTAILQLSHITTANMISTFKRSATTINPSCEYYAPSTICPVL